MEWSFKKAFNKMIEKFGIFAIKIVLYLSFFILLIMGAYLFFRCKGPSIRDRINSWFSTNKIETANTKPVGRNAQLGKKEIDGSIQVKASEITVDPKDPTVVIAHGKRFKLPKGITKDTIEYLILLKSNAVFVVTKKDKSVLDLLKHKDNK